MSNSEKAHSKFAHAYAVVRVDLPISADNPQNSIAVVKVFPSKLAADNEVSRLNEINAEKGCLYFTQTTRLVTEGQGEKLGTDGKFTPS